MMKLNTMSAIMLACAGENDSPLVPAIISRWPHDPGSVRFVRVSANCVFTFHMDGRRCFLRFNHATERTYSAIQAEIAFITAMAGKGLHVAVPIPSRAGKCIEQVETACGEMLAVVFSAMPGRPHAEITDLSPHQLACWGEALGALHHAAAGYIDARGRPTWQEHLTFIADYLPAHDAAMWLAYEQVQQELAILPVDKQNYGLIHYDFELDNIIWDGNHAGIIDFDDCAWYWFAADIAFALRDLFDDRADHVDFEHEVFRAFIAGYRQARIIDDDELRAIPLFLRLHNLTTYAKLLRTLAAGKQAHEPEWMDGLRAKLTSAVQRYWENIARYNAL